MAASTRATRALGAFLRELRIASGLSAIQVGECLDQSHSTVSRYERGDLRVIWATITTLVKLYGGGKAELAEARRRYEATKNEPKPVRLARDTHPAFRRLVNEERVAAGIRLVEPSVMPGLAQIEPYTLALGDQLHDPGSRSMAASTIRLGRQQRLDRSEPRPLKLHAVIDEIVVTRLVGGPAVQRQQLLHILDLMGQQNVTIQVVKAAAGAYGVTSGGLHIIDYEEATEPSAAYFEYPAGAAFVEDEHDVQRFTEKFDRAVRAASSTDETAEFLHQQVRALEQR
ncbi:helix-turn-helix domain-containing protein [Amycolatopsis sp. H20-H5]|uniref:helix-turn-helix domain-containing protein n=1 Tax=Amycolatopsis sp. H20-H5 TaxID=3046309 RepID=UPI002DBA4BD3|nr:helix-turn-helix transcriptional regulator [Amycolatopsis sp. H20-H5]MEC3977754.1 helix-turn-helix transcriptional regulator [Amycolatopsis sp. H20-H5]